MTQVDKDYAGDDWGEALAEQEEDLSNGEQFQLDNSVIDAIPIEITVELGSTFLTYKQLKKLNQGSILELNKLAGENLDIKANGKLIGHGEVVVINEQFGIRFTESTTNDERLFDRDKF